MRKTLTKMLFVGGLTVLGAMATGAPAQAALSVPALPLATTAPEASVQQVQYYRHGYGYGYGPRGYYHRPHFFRRHFFARRFYHHGYYR